MCRVEVILISMLLWIALMNTSHAEAPLYDWPISGKTPNNLSSTFGPRLLNGSYDFHRGIDIPVACGTPVHAIADGIVRLSGVYWYYTDRVVQITHSKLGGYYYSNYMHMLSVVFSEDDEVQQGDIIGYSGESNIGGNTACDPDNNFDHLHFEIRDNDYHEDHAIHPLVLLPYANETVPMIQFSSLDVSDPISPIVSFKVHEDRDENMELDLNRVEVIIYDKSGGSLVVVDQHAYDMMEWNLLYYDFMDNPAYNGVVVSPVHFNASSESYEIDFTFNDLNGVTDADDLAVEVRAVDVTGGFSNLFVVGTECSNLPVRIAGTALEYYLLQDAYDAAAEGDIIQSQAVTFIGNLYIDQDKSITLEGGYDCTYSSNNQKSFLNGMLTIGNGIAVISNFTLTQ